MTYDEWMRVRSPWDVVSAAAHDRAAADAAVSRIIDTMLEIQLDYDHVRPGWPPVSSTAQACSAAAGELQYSTGGGDPMMVAYTRTWRESEWHAACAWLMSRLTPRMQAALLMQAARIRPTRQRTGSWWCQTARELVANQEEAMRRLHLHRGAEPFASVRSMQLYATRARGLIRDWLEVEKKLSPTLDAQLCCVLLCNHRR